MLNTWGFNGHGADAGAVLNNTALPVISAAVIGTPMEVYTPGTYDGGVVSAYSYEWYVNGVNKGPAYTPVEADRVGGWDIKVLETVVGTLGETGAANSLAKVARRTEPTVAYTFGKKTPVRSGTTHYGKVLLKDLWARTGRLCLGPGVDTVATPISSWGLDTTAPDGGVISGVLANWVWTADLYTPCRAQAIAGDYVFRTKCTFGDGVVEYMEITITAKDNTWTISSYDCNNYDFVFRNAGNLAGIDLAGDIGRMELATGSRFVNAQMRLQYIRPVNWITLCHADPARPSPVAYLNIDGCSRMNIGDPAGGNGFNTNDSSASTSNSKFLITRTDAGTSGPLKMYDCMHKHDNPQFRLSGTGEHLIGLKVQYVDQLDVYGWKSNHIGDAFSMVTTTGVRVHAPEIDDYWDNGAIFGDTGSTNDVTVYDAVIRCPMYSGAHLDGLQVSDAANGGKIKFVRTIIAQAGGNGAGQGIFSGGPAAGPIDVSGIGLLAGIGLVNGLFLSKGNNSSWSNFAITRAELGAGGDVADPNMPKFFDGGGGASYSGVQTVSDGFVCGQVSYGAGYTSGTNVLAYNGVENAAHFYSGMTPRAYLAQYSEAQWKAMTFDQIRATYKAAFRPAVGSPIDGHGPIDAATGDWNATVLAAV